MLRDHGQAKKYHHDVEGYNGRLDAIQAGLLHAKLAHLASWNTRRRDHAAEYNRLLANNEALTLPYEPSWSRAVYHLYVIRTDDRDGMMEHLKKWALAREFITQSPCTCREPMSRLTTAWKPFLWQDERLEEIVSLPMFPQLTAEQQARVAKEVIAFTARPVQKQPSGGKENALVAAAQTL